MPDSDVSDEPELPQGPANRLPAAAGQTALDRSRLRASEAAVTSQVIAFQLARRLDPGPAKPGQARPPITPLSTRELEVLSLLATGQSDGEIGERLFISKKTASVHVANIKGKLGASSRVEIALLAARLGLVDEDVAQAAVALDVERRGRTVVCPFKGLASFDAADAAYFFGREQVVAEMVARLAGSTFLGVVGPSGSGKSSVVRAGLVPALADGVLPGSDQWTTAVLRPGAAPSVELAHALTLAVSGRSVRLGHESVAKVLDRLPTHSRLLLVVDQFEELFTVCEDKNERADFVRILVAMARDPAHRAIVVIAVRADYYGRCAAYRDLAELLGANHLLIGPMTADEIARAVELPGRAAGLRIERELVSALVGGVLDEPGGLPVLSTTLLDLWGRRDGRTLRLATYEQIGGVSGAVSRLAEAAFGRLTADQQRIARAVFLRLAAPGDGGVAVRRPASLTEFDVDRDPDVAHVLAVLTDSRLLTASDGSIEVAHEVLLQEWPRLSQWLEEDADGRRVREHLIRAAAEWEQAGSDPAELYRGARLAGAQEWASEHDVELNASERAFLDESRLAGEQEVERQRRSNRRLRVLLAGVAALLIVAVSAGGFALAQLGRVAEQAWLAEARELYASAIAVVDEDPELSILLTLEAAKLEPPTAEAVTNLHRAVQASRGLLEVRMPKPTIPPSNLGIALSPDGRTLFVAADSGSVQVWDVDSRELVRTLGAPRVDEQSLELDVALSRDGGQAALIDEAGRLHIWDVTDGAEQQLPAPGYAIGLPAFSPDGRRLAALTSDGVTAGADAGLVLSVWDLDTGTVIQDWRRKLPGAIAFDEAGDRLLVTGCVCAPDEPFLERLDIQTGGHTTAIGLVAAISDSRPTAAQISRDGTRLATVGRDGAISLWDAADGALIRSFGQLRDTASFVAFSPDGTRVATTSQGGTVRIWALETGRLLRTLVGQRGNVASAWFSEDGTRIATGSSTLTARVWDLSASRMGEVAGFDLGPGFSQVVDVDHQGSVVAVLGRSCATFCLGPAAVIDLVSGRRMELDDQGGAAIAVMPDGSGVLSQAGVTDEDGNFGTGSVRMHRLWTGDVAYELEGICAYWIRGTAGCGFAPEVPWNEQAASFAFRGDGSVVAMRGSLESLATWDATNGRLIGLIAGRYVAGPVFDVDGALSAAAIVDEAGIRLLDPVGPAGIARMNLPAADRIAFAPDGSVVGIAAASINTQLYVAATWEARPPLPVQSHDLDFNAVVDRLVTADTDGFIRLWSVDSGMEMQAIPVDRTGIGSEVGRVAFLDDERHLLTVDSGAVLVVTTDVDELLEIARSRLTRQLSAAECLKYLRGSCPSG